MLPGYWLGKLRLPGVVGATPYFTSKLAAISIPAMPKVHILRWKRLASREQGRTTKRPIAPFPTEPVQTAGAQADDCAERTEERKAVQIQRAATDLFNARQPRQFTARDVGFAKPADIQYITRGGDGAPEQPGALRMWRLLRQISLSASQKRARTSCFLTARSATVDYYDGRLTKIASPTVDIATAPERRARSERKIEMGLEAAKRVSRERGGQ